MNIYVILVNFNSTLVRLKGSIYLRAIEIIENFNSTLVRLKAFAL